MNKLKNLALMAAVLDMARLANGLDVPISKPRIDHRTLGSNPKRCKSCEHFKDCQRALSRNPMDVACGDYKRKKK